MPWTPLKSPDYKESHLPGPMQLSQNATTLSKTLQGQLKLKLEAGLQTSLFSPSSHSAARQSGGL